MEMQSLLGRLMKSCAVFPINQALHINDCYYTYSELLAYAEKIHYQLHTFKQQKAIGIYCEDSVWTYATILAISGVNAAYVPLNPKLPTHQLLSIIETCGIELVLCENALPFEHPINEVIIDVNSSNRKAFQNENNEHGAYILFTSGSTGLPKGIPISLNNINAFLDYCAKQYNFKPTDRFLQAFDLSFDVSVFSMFSAFNCGACVYAVSNNGFKYLNILDTLLKHHITVSAMVPTTLLYIDKYLVNIQLPSLRYSIFTAEKLHHTSVLKWSACAVNSQIMNWYGPTEATIVCTSYLWNPVDSVKEIFNDCVPLGLPFDGVNYVLINETNEIVHNEVGELCLNGPQVFSGYLNSSEGFITIQNKRYYKTGDLVSVNTSNDLIYHGRKDFQIKINGFRIELAAIEIQLSTIFNCTTLVDAVKIGNQDYLVAYIETDKKIDKFEVNNQLKVYLAEYMLPNYYVSISAWPLNINGKVDREKLKAMFYEHKH